MSYAALAQNTYSQASQASLSPKAIEIDAFTRVTKLLQDVENDTASFPQAVEALHLNKKLWSMLATSLADDANGLDTDLRAGLLNLALFTENHSRKVLDKTASVAPMIEINLAVLRGLKSKGLAQ